MRRVIVVNSDGRTQYLIDAALTKKYQALRFRSVLQATEAHASDPCDLILMNSANLNSVAQGHIRLLRANGDTTPIAVLTDESVSSMVEACIDLGINKYLRVPCPAVSITAGVDSLIDPHSGKETTNTKALENTYGPLFAVLSHKVGSKRVAAKYLLDHYSGPWDNLGDWAQREATINGSLDSVPTSMLPYFHFEQFAADLESRGEIYVLPLGKSFHVFTGINDC